MPTSFKRPRSARRAALAVGSGIVVLAIAGFALVYFLIFPTSSPKPFSLSTASPATSATAPATTSTTGSSAAQLAGAWKIAGGSQGGYRVREKLAFLPAQSDAVGRTSQITGGAGISESGGQLTISSASFAVAVNTLTSDRSMRDEKIHSIGLESDRYPTATFVLARPLTLPASALRGRVAHISTDGVVTIHGTSRQERIPLEMSLSGTTLETAGSLTFPWSEFNMTAPSVAGFVNVTGKATMEFDLRMQRA